MLSRGRSVRRSLGVVAAFTALALGPSATSAGADVRSAAVVDAVDPTVAFDITRADVTVDNVSGRLLLVVRLGHQLQAQAGEYPSLTARVSNSTFCPDGGGVDDKVGDTIIKIRPANSPDPSGQRPLEAIANTEFRREFPAVPLSVSPDGLTYSVSLADELLVGANLRCFGIESFGRGTYDPRQPDGGPTSDDPDTAWFAGFDPALPQNRTFKAVSAASSPQTVRTASGKYTRARLRAKCSLGCIAGVSAYAVRSGTSKELKGVDFTEVFDLKERGDDDDSKALFVTFNAASRRALNREFRLRGKATLVVDVVFTDKIARQVTRRQRVTIKPAPKPKPKRRPKRSSSGGGGGSSSSGGRDRDCSDFSTQAAAQRYFEANGGSASNNVDRLDSDGDGIACEANS